MVLDLAFHKDPSGSVSHLSLLGFTGNNHALKVVLDASLIQVVGIMPTLIIAQIGVGRAVHDIEAHFRMTNISSSQSAPVSSAGASSKTRVKTPPTKSTPFSGGIVIRTDTKKHMYDVSLPPPHSSYKEDSGYPYSGHNSTSSKETFSFRENFPAQPRYNPQNFVSDHHFHRALEPRDGQVVDLPRDIEQGEDGRQFEMDGCVLDYVLREDVETGVVVWKENGDNLTPLPRSARLQKPRPTRSNSRE